MIRASNRVAESKALALARALTVLDRNSHCAFLQFDSHSIKKATGEADGQLLNEKLRMKLGAPS
jgi:hypothetical protein